MMHSASCLFGGRTGYFHLFVNHDLKSLSLLIFAHMRQALILTVLCFCRKYEQALEYHRQALVLIPQHASTYSAIGYVHSLMGDFESAIDYFHTVFLFLYLSNKYR